MAFQFNSVVPNSSDLKPAGLSFLLLALSLLSSPLTILQTAIAQGTVECELEYRWMVQFETNRQVHIPLKFPVTISVINNSDSTVTNPAATIELPQGLTLAPVVQPKRKSSSIVLLPGEIKVFRWDVTMDSSYTPSGSKSIKALIEYSDMIGGQPVYKSCEGIRILELVTTIPHLELMCELFAIDSVREFNDTLLVPTVVPVRCRVHNLSDKPAQLGRTSLYVQGYAGASIPPFDRHRNLHSPLQPGDSIEFVWNVDVEQLQHPRIAHISVLCHDTIDFEQSSCATSIFIPKITGLSCQTEGVKLMRMNYGTGEFEPDSIVVRMQVSNHYDSLQFQPFATIHLEDSPHFKLSKFTDSIQYSALLDKASSINFFWTLKVSTPPADYAEDLIRFYASSFRYPYGTECVQKVVFEDPVPDPECYLHVPESIDLCGDEYCPSVFTANYRIANPGYETLAVSKLLLELGEGLTTRGPMEVQMDPLGQQESEFAFWTIETKRSVYARSSFIRVSALDDDGNSLLLCEEEFELPPMQQPIRCSIQGVDSLRFNPTTRKYYPALFTILAYIKNLTDTTYSNIQVTFDGDHSSHFTIATGQSWSQSIPLLEPGADFTFGWEVLLNRSSSETITDTIFVQHSSKEFPDKVDCALPVVIESNKIVSVEGNVLDLTMALEQNHPNPFLGLTSIRYSVAKRSPVTIAVYNALGILVSTPVSRIHPPGTHLIHVDGLLPGVYLYVMTTPDGILSRQMLMR
jgi:hypothetical protein